MRLSIRNRLAATVQAVTVGEVMAVVNARLAGGQDVTAAITREAIEDLPVREGSAITVLIKSTEVSVALDLTGHLSIRNQLAGTVTAVEHGDAMTTVKVEIDGGEVLTAAITKESAEKLLVVGTAVTALIKSTDVAISME
jgi:molybdate transport system regulatory protein